MKLLKSILVTTIFFIATIISICQTGQRTLSIKIPEFKQSTQKFPVGFQLAVEDLNNDKYLDVVFSAGPRSSIFFNDGKGFFKESNARFPITTHGIAIGDIDLDGDLDLVFSPHGPGNPSTIYLNDGKGNFEASSSILDNGIGVSLIDLENDGDLDAIVELPKGDLINLNDGNGNFTKSSAELPGYSSFHDLNGDGFIDLTSAENGKGLRVYLNDKKGNFYEYKLFLNESISRFVSFADVDNDGDIDIIYSSDLAKSTPSGILLNDGVGNFTESGQDLAIVETGRIGTGDLNNDGFVDIIFADRLRPAQVWMNDCKGNFFDSGVRLMEGGACHSIVVKDIDNDGDSDVFIANYLNQNGNSGLWFNQFMENKNSKGK